MMTELDRARDALRLPLRIAIPLAALLAGAAWTILAGMALVL